MPFHQPPEFPTDTAAVGVAAGTGTAGANLQRHAREAEAAARIVNHVHLADVVPRLQSRQRHIELEATASRSGMLIAVASTFGVSYTFTPPSRTRCWSAPAPAPLSSFAAAPA